MFNAMKGISKRISLLLALIILLSTPVEAFAQINAAYDNESVAEEVYEADVSGSEDESIINDEGENDFPEDMIPEEEPEEIIPEEETKEVTKAGSYPGSFSGEVRFTIDSEDPLVDLTEAIQEAIELVEKEEPNFLRRVTRSIDSNQAEELSVDIRFIANYTPLVGSENKIEQLLKENLTIGLKAQYEGDNEIITDEGDNILPGSDVTDRLSPKEYEFTRENLKAGIDVEIPVKVTGYTDLNSYLETTFGISFDTSSMVNEVNGVSLEGYLKVSPSGGGSGEDIPTITLEFYEIAKPQGPLGGIESLTKNVRNITKPNNGLGPVEGENFYKEVQATVGDEVEYEITLTNTSNASIPIKIVDPIQVGLTIEESVNKEGNDIVITDTLAPGQTGTYKYKATVTSIDNGVIKNTATTNKLKIYDGVLTPIDKVNIRKTADGKELVLNNGKTVVVYGGVAWISDESEEGTLKASATVKMPDGKLRVTKEFHNDFNLRIKRAANNPISFKIQVTGPHGYSEEINLAAGGIKDLENLYYGEYTVTELEANGYTPSYKVGESSETVEPAKVTINNAEENKVTVINTQTGAKETTENIKVTKDWKNGPKPDTVIELWRSGQNLEGSEINEKVGEFTANATKIEETFEELAKHDPTGREFNYYVKEAEVENYTTEIKGDKATGFTVTNTYVIPKLPEFKARKIWEGDETVTRPEMNFELWRKIGTELDEKVPGAEVKKVDGVITEAIWTDLDKTDINGREYTFYVKESFVTDKASNANWILGEYDFATNSITNTVVTGDDKAGKLDVEKILKNEDSNRTKRSVSNQIKFKIIVTDEYDNETSVDIFAGETKTIENLYYGDYTVKEEDTNGYIPSYAPEKVTVTKDQTENPKFVVTNSRDEDNPEDPNRVDIEINKVWEDGPKPDTTLLLKRKVVVEEGGVEKDIIDDDFTKTLKVTKDTLKFEFEKQAKHDEKGREYQYYVEEPTVPENYEATITPEGAVTGNKLVFTVTNKYTSPIIPEFTVTKSWEGDETVTRPTMVLTLMRHLEGEEEKDRVAVPDVETKEVNGTTTTATWNNLPETNAAGVKYIYSAKEEFKEDKASNANWILGEYDFATNSITNTVVTGDDKAGKLDVEKILKNELETTRSKRSVSEPIEFTVVVTDEYENEIPVTIKAGEIISVGNLYYGDYTVEETVTHGYVPSYEPTELTVEKDQAKTPRFVVTNSRKGGTDDPNGLTINITKIWDGGPKPETVIELWRKGVELDGTEIDEKIGHLDIEDGMLGESVTQEFLKLAKHDPSGREFDYYVKEPNVPLNYAKDIVEEKTEKGYNYTVTNTYLSTDPTKTNSLDEDQGVKPKDEFTYTITLTNPTSYAIKNTPIVDKVPESLEILEVKLSDGGNAEKKGNEVSYIVPEILAKSNFTMEIKVKVKDNVAIGTEIQNIAVVDGEKVPDRLIEVTALENNKVAKRNINEGTNKEPVYEPIDESYAVDYGDKYIYEITTKNIGNIKLKNVKIEDDIPRELDILSVVLSDGGQVTRVGNKIEYLIPEINHGETFTMTITVAANYNAIVGTQIGNVAYVDKVPVPDDGVNFGPSGLRLLKTNNTDSSWSLPNAEFELFKSDGKSLGKWETGRNGAFTIKNIPAGEYYFIETKAPPYHRLSKTPVMVTVNEGTINTLIVANRISSSSPATYRSLPNVDSYVLESSIAQNTILRTSIGQDDVNKDFVTVSVLYEDKITDPEMVKNIRLSNQEITIKDKSTGKVVLNQNTNNMGETTVVLPYGDYVAEVQNPDKNIFVPDALDPPVQEFSLPASEEDSEVSLFFNKVALEETTDNEEDSKETEVDKDVDKKEVDDKETTEKDKSTNTTTSVEKKEDNKVVATDTTAKTEEKANGENKTSEITKTGYLRGYEDGSIRPKANITRGEVAAILARLNKAEATTKTSYTDVKAGSWYEDYINYVSEVGLMEGYEDGSFKPEQNITRGEFTTVVSRYKELTGGEAPFKDIVGHWSEESIKSVYTKGWISGYEDGSFKPDKYISRAEVTSIVNKMEGRVIVEKELDKLSNKYSDLNKSDWYYYDMLEASKM
ncbi:S-layer homology domain-containing protein [Anaerosphaera multitolerans]|uniref:Cna B-type domain-containing protein n=1 Tax=Anaerosphaera multitolerans TaxID=2487351 RepID=A0A437S555_9FIRM|nr:S-layer homology domain-containing protein [Anaerosphaera multitolerans]RVU54140.1 Cna B-type domain-containing protein [Anaerosphaera multitolerans]